MSILGTISSVATTQGSTSEDRLREAAYTTPSGTRIEFHYSEVRRSGLLRGASYEFAGINDSYIKRRGFGGRVYPIAAIFSGDNNDLEGLAYEAGLYEDGFGVLESPRYGRIDVIPMGEVRTYQDLVNDIMSTVVEVEFFTSLKTIYPSSRASVENEITSQLGSFDVEASQEFEANTELDSVVNKESFKASVRGVLNDISAAMDGISDLTSASRRELGDNIALINRGIDVLVGQPILLAQQITNLVTAPSRALVGIVSRLEGYRDLLDRIIASRAGHPEFSVVGLGIPLSAKAKNDFQLSQLVAMAAVSGSVRTLLTSKGLIGTKGDALVAATELVSQFDALIAWREAGFAVTGQVDPGPAYLALQSATSLTAGNLVQISFSLAQERVIRVDRDRTIIDLAAELYGDVTNASLDTLIETNGLNGDQIIEIAKGTMIRYFPGRA